MNLWGPRIHRNETTQVLGRGFYPASNGQVPDAEILEPDDLDETEQIGIGAGWFGGVDDKPQIRAGNGEHIAVERDGSNFGMNDCFAARTAGGVLARRS